MSFLVFSKIVIGILMLVVACLLSRYSGVYSTEFKWMKSADTGDIFCRGGVLYKVIAHKPGETINFHISKEL